jgi:hypothetical protein
MGEVSVGGAPNPRFAVALTQAINTERPGKVPDDWYIKARGKLLTNSGEIGGRYWNWRCARRGRSSVTYGDCQAGPSGEWARGMKRQLLTRRVTEAIHTPDACAGERPTVRAYPSAQRCRASARSGWLVDPGCRRP